MMLPDLQRLSHIRDYCIEIQKTSTVMEILLTHLIPTRITSVLSLFSVLQIRELSGGPSQEFRQATANRVQWGPMKGMGNLVAHNYSGSCNQISCRC